MAEVLAGSSEVRATATEELRRMLDERGVKWKRMRGHKHDGTEWHDASGAHVSAVQEYTWDGTEWPEGKLHVSRGAAWLTPEQAVEATMGRGECHKLPASGDTTCIVRCFGRYEIEFGYWKCSNCGVECFEGAKYCMNCGAKVVSE